MIQADLEGATGVTNFGQVIPGSSAYARACASLAEDVNAAIRGIFEAAERHTLHPIVDVVDGHFHMHNLDLEQLDPRIHSYTAGYERSLLQLEGLDRTYDAIFCIGQHDATGGRGLMAHTWVRWRWVVNGQECTETLLNAYTAGEFDVPLALITGDQVLVGKTRYAFERAGTAPEAVVTKEALGFSTARCYHPVRTRSEIMHAASRAIEGLRAGRFRPVRVPSPVRIELTVTDAHQAAQIREQFSSVFEVGTTTVGWEAETFLEAITQGTKILRLFFEGILTRACQNLATWYRVAILG